ncbi:sensor histidine kinase [Paenibacillus hodogayensis]|uniref:histidine kinase n=1 Tax=Paenibacillus hodogayensis TaxID=279208 RepID=A0ABV5VVA1_9BACL
MAITVRQRVRAVFARLQYRQKLLVAILSVALLPVIAVSSVYLIAYAQAKTGDILDGEKNRFAGEWQQLDNKFYSGIKKSVYITNNLQIVQMLKADYQDDLLAYMNNLENVKAVLEALKSDDLQSEIAIYGYNPSLYRTDIVKKIGDMDPALKDRVMQNRDTYPVRTFGRSPANGRMEVRIYSKIMDLSETLAVTEVVLPLEESFDRLRALLAPGSFLTYRAKNGETFLVGTNGVKGEPDAKGYYAIPFELKSAQDRMVLFVGKTSVWQRLGSKLAIPLVMLLGLVLTIAFTIKSVTFLLTKRLTDLMGTVRTGMDGLEPAAASTAEEGNDELGQLDRTFKELVVHIHEHYRQAAAHEVERRLLETELLQLNINPHVLYNTLSSIKWVYGSGDGKLDKLIDDMVDFYRLFLNRGEASRPLVQEIGMVEKYMEIHKFSYDAEFDYEVSIDEAVRETVLLRNMLQPIVENGIVHGISRLHEGGRLTITAGRDGDCVVIEVADNGPGMDRAPAALLAEETASGGRESSAATRFGSGYALTNIDRRIKLYYGESYGIRIAGSPGAGTVVTLRLPFHTAT